MADGGFLVKFDGKEIARCYAVAFDYDQHECIVNGKERLDFPEDISTIMLEVEKG